MGKLVDPVHGAWTGGAVMGPRLTGRRHTVAMGHLSSPVVAGEDEEDEAQSAVGSSKLEWRWRDGAMTMKNSGDSSSLRGL
jgi:hypothetical protein